MQAKRRTGEALVSFVEQQCRGGPSGIGVAAVERPDSRADSYTVEREVPNSGRAVPRLREGDLVQTVPMPRAAVALKDAPIRSSSWRIC